MEANALNLLVLPMVQRIALAYLVMALLKLALDAIEWASARLRASRRARIARLVFPDGPARREDFVPRPARRGSAEDEPARRQRAR